MTYQERQAKANISSWRRSEARSIWQAYGRPSYKKEKAWSYCQDLCRRNNGHDLKVISCNSFKFTAGFEFVDPETGVVRFMYISPAYDVAVDQ